MLRSGAWLPGLQYSPRTEAKGGLLTFGSDFYWFRELEPDMGNLKACRDV